MTNYKSKFLALYTLIDNMHHNLDYTGSISNKDFQRLFDKAVALKSQSDNAGNDIKREYLDYTVGP